MKKDLVRKKYDLSWLKKGGDEDFNLYERNLPLEEFFQKKGKVLDVACGSGTVGIWLQNKGFEVSGIDISKVAIDLAKKRGLKKVICGDIEAGLPFKNSSFDYVFCGDIIEHLFNPMGLLQEAKRVLKKDGKLIVSCPNTGYWYYRLAYLVKGRVPGTEGGWAKPWEWEHIRFFDKEILFKLLGETGLRPKKLVGVCRRRLDNFLARFFPLLFGSIIIVEAQSR